MRNNSRSLSSPARTGGLLFLILICHTEGRSSLGDFGMRGDGIRQSTARC